MSSAPTKTIPRGSVLATLAVAALAAAAGCGGGGSSPTAPSTPGAPFSQTDLVVGTGAEATAGRQASVSYTLWLYDPGQPQNKGRQIETNVGGPAFSFVLGAGRVIRGWEQGVPGMRVGGQRRLTIPPELAYGAAGSPPAIPPNATLVFDISLIAVQ